MSRTLVTALYLLVMVAVIVGVDVLFFRDQFQARLLSNIAIVAVFLAFYFIVLNR